MRNYLLAILLLVSQISFAQFSVNQKTISGYTFFDFQNQQNKNFNYIGSDTIKVQLRNNQTVGLNIGLGKGKFVSEKKLKTWSIHYNFTSNSALSENFDSLEKNRLSFNNSKSVEHNISLRNTTTNFVSIQPKFGFLWSYTYSLQLLLSKREYQNTSSGNDVFTTKNPSIGIGANLNAGLWYKINERFFVQASYNLVSAHLSYSNLSNSSSSTARTSNINLGINAINSVNMGPEYIGFGFTYIMKP
ncbi:MAG: hypothetical protein ACOVP1_04160 [Bacteroidia bacterium]